LNFHEIRGPTRRENAINERTCVFLRDRLLVDMKRINMRHESRMKERFLKRIQGVKIKKKHHLIDLRVNENQLNKIYQEKDPWRC